MPPKRRFYKKKKKSGDPEEIHKEEAASKYSSLIFQSKKAIRKEAKVVKSFECQKIIRKIKSLKDEDAAKNSNDDSNVDAAVKDQMHQLDEKLKTLKDFDIDHLVQEVLRKAGVEEKEEPPEKKEDDNDDNVTKHETMELDDFTKKLIKSMMKHKRMSSALESIREKLIDYNTWLARKEDFLKNGGKNAKEPDTTSKSDEKKTGKKRGRDLDLEGHDGGAGMFIESLSGHIAVDEDDVLEGYEGFEAYDGEEDDIDDYIAQPQKRNRPGQRQRKAKAMAIEARKAGRHWDNSINRRKKKKRVDEDFGANKHESASGLDKSKEINVAEVAKMGKDWKEEGKAHPSWAAREAQKAKSGLGIVAFAGKKITFD